MTAQPAIEIPASKIARAAAEVAAQYHSPALVHHCVRSYLWAAAYGRRHGIGYDAELLYVAAMLHDLGLVAEFDSHTVAFEEAGGHVAWVFGAGAGWPVERRHRAREVIVAHMRGAEPDIDPEGHLLAVATSLDISGRDADDWPSAMRAEVIAAYPRLDLGVEFLRCFQDQAQRKPASSAAEAIRGGIAARIAANPL
jgi:HD domain-containing protein